MSLINLSAEHERGEIGYWVAVPFWNQGYGTEAARAMVDYAFGPLGLHRVVGRFMKRNRASGRVMVKIGMKEEGCLREHDQRKGRYEDVMLYAILRSEWFGPSHGK